MADIGNLILVATIALLGGLPSIYIIVSMIVMLTSKIKNKILYGKSLYD